MTSSPKSSLNKRKKYVPRSPKVKPRLASPLSPLDDVTVRAAKASVPSSERSIRICKGMVLPCRWCGVRIGHVDKPIKSGEIVTPSHIEFVDKASSNLACSKCRTPMTNGLALWTSLGWL